MGLVDSLLVVYLLTRCDASSYPFRQGRRKAANLAVTLADKHPHLALSGNENNSNVEVNEATVDEARQAPYDCSGLDSLDILREHIFASSKVDLCTLPPTEDAYLLSTKVYMITLLPSEFIQSVTDGKLAPIMS